MSSQLKLSEHLVRVQGLQRQVYLLSISTDPAVDAPSVLKEYGRRYDADFSFWAFLTGAPVEMARAWERFGVVTVTRARGDVDHTSMTFLLDRAGRPRLIYLGCGWREEVWWRIWPSFFSGADPGDH
ncbi:MAG: SCO family protein [Candidatus Methylomirabilales bacterium]